MWYLRKLDVTDEKNPKETDVCLYLPAGSYTVGRQPDQAQVVVTDDKSISRNHGVISVEPLPEDAGPDDTPSITYQDFSRYGSFVNATLHKAGSAPVQLAAGDYVQFGHRSPFRLQRLRHVLAIPDEAVRQRLLPIASHLGFAVLDSWPCDGGGGGAAAATLLVAGVDGEGGAGDLPVDCSVLLLLAQRGGEWAESVVASTWLDAWAQRSVPAAPAPSPSQHRAARLLVPAPGGAKGGGGGWVEAHVNPGDRSHLLSGRTVVLPKALRLKLPRWRQLVQAVEAAGGRAVADDEAERALVAGAPGSTAAAVVVVVMQQQRTERGGRGAGLPTHLRWLPTAALDVLRDALLTSSAQGLPPLPLPKGDDGTTPADPTQQLAEGGEKGRQGAAGADGDETGDDDDTDDEDVAGGAPTNLLASLGGVLGMTSSPSPSVAGPAAALPSQQQQQQRRQQGLAAGKRKARQLEEEVQEEEVVVVAADGPRGDGAQPAAKRAKASGQPNQTAAAMTAAAATASAAAAPAASRPASSAALGNAAASQWVAKKPKPEAAAAASAAPTLHGAFPGMDLQQQQAGAAAAQAASALKLMPPPRARGSRRGVGAAAAAAAAAATSGLDLALDARAEAARSASAAATAGKLEVRALREEEITVVQEPLLLRQGPANGFPAAAEASAANSLLPNFKRFRKGAIQQPQQRRRLVPLCSSAYDQKPIDASAFLREEQAKRHHAALADELFDARLKAKKAAALPDPEEDDGPVPSTAPAGRGRAQPTFGKAAGKAVGGGRGRGKAAASTRTRR